MTTSWSPLQRGSPRHSYNAPDNSYHSYHSYPAVPDAPDNSYNDDYAPDTTFMPRLSYADSDSMPSLGSNLDSQATIVAPSPLYEALHDKRQTDMTAMILLGMDSLYVTDPVTTEEEDAVLSAARAYGERARWDRAERQQRCTRLLGHGWAGLAEHTVDIVLGYATEDWICLAACVE